MENNHLLINLLKLTALANCDIKPTHQNMPLSRELLEAYQTSMPGPSGYNHRLANIHGKSDINQVYSNMPGISERNNNNLIIQAPPPPPSAINHQNVQANATIDDKTNDTIDNLFVMCPNSERDAENLHYEIHPHQRQPIKCYSAKLVLDWAESDEILQRYNNQMPGLISTNEQPTETVEERIQRWRSDMDILTLEGYAEQARTLLKQQENLTKKY